MFTRAELQRALDADELLLIYQAQVDTAVGFARSIGAETVAEGVETVAIRDRVRELGCDIGQGYLWSQQVLGDELPGVLRSIGLDGASAKPVA